jgi:hypothetical protein
MRTPAGKECPYYYGDFHRGREIEECRQAKGNPESLPWQPKDCARCPMPDILRANSSETMRLKMTIRPALLGLKRQMKVEAWCEKHQIAIEKPYVGCPQCIDENPGLKLFKEALKND